MPDSYAFNYRSPQIAFDNIWDLWFHKTQPIAVISVRGTIRTGASFLANFYAAMIPAKGEIALEDDLTFQYELAQNPKAAVHVGWFISIARVL